jgi:16S rRNA (guanine527-N7)-methyltransferase
MGSFTADEASFVRTGASALGVDLSARQIDVLGQFLALLQIWNRRHRIVGTRDRPEIIRKHILDSLAPAMLLASSARLVDLGTGAGLPGVPLAIALEHLSVTLVDSRRVPTSFLRDAVRRLTIPRISVVESRVERLTAVLGAQSCFDAAISRAWSGLSRFLEVCAGLLRPGGVAIAMKGRRARDELAGISCIGDTFDPPRLVDYTLPGGPEARALLVFSRR